MASVTWRALVLWALKVGGQEHNVYPTLYGPPVSRKAADMARYITDETYPDHGFFMGFVGDPIENTARMIADNRMVKTLARWPKLPGLVRVTDWFKKGALKGWNDANRFDADCNPLPTPPPPPEGWYTKVAEMAPAILMDRTKGTWPKDPEAIVAAVIASGIDPDEPDRA